MLVKEVLLLGPFLFNEQQTAFVLKLINLVEKCITEEFYYLGFK